MSHEFASPSALPAHSPKHPARYARRTLAVLSCAAMLALVGVLRAGQPGASSSSAAGLLRAAGMTVHTTSGGSASTSSAAGTASAGASAARPASAPHTVSDGS